jgi:hypothetical protein
MDTLVICPWCPDFKGSDPRHAGVSHQMCPACLAKLLARLTDSQPEPRHEATR